MNKRRLDFTKITEGADAGKWEAAVRLFGIAGDEIGISGGSYTNVCYLTKDGDGRFTVKTPGDEIYF